MLRLRRCPRTICQLSTGVLNVFDRDLKRRQRDWAASRDDYEVYHYLRDEVAFRLADRIYDVKRVFSVAVDLGCGAGHVARHVFKEHVDSLLQVDVSRSMLKRCNQPVEVVNDCIHADEELITFRQNSLDLVLSSLSMHWINDLPGTFKRVFDALRPDGLFLAAVFGGNTLYELRCSLQLAEMERLGGMGSHMSPQLQADDLVTLLNAAGFALTTVDADRIVVNYPDVAGLLYDLRGMAESQATWLRAPTLRRDVLLAATAIYKEMYGKNGDHLPATFQILYLAGWKPSANTPRPAKRGSGKMSLKDLGKLFDK